MNETQNENFYVVVGSDLGAAIVIRSSTIC